MLSRVAENIYWMARHLERTENTSRLVALHSETRLDRPDRSGFFWEPVLRITGGLKDYRQRGLGPREREATNFLVGDLDNPSSVQATVGRARENIRILLETLPRESWEAVNALHQIASRPGAAAPQRRDEHLREIVARVQGLAGLFLGAMNDDEGYALLRLGRAIERGDFAARVLLDSVASRGEGPGDDLQAAEWVGVLRSLTAYQMYRRSVQGTITRTGVLRFLAGSTAFPRSLAYCVLEAGRALERLPHSGAVTQAAAKLSLDLSAGLADVGEPDLARLVAEAQAGLEALHERVAATYFVPLDEAPARLAQRQGT